MSYGSRVAMAFLFPLEGLELFWMSAAVRMTHVQ